MRIMRRPSVLLVSLLALLLLPGCGLVHSGNNSCVSDPNNTAAHLVGTWSANCVGGQGGQNVNDVIVFSGTTATETTSYFALQDYSCGSAVQGTVVVTSAYSVGAAASLSPIFNSVNFTVSSATAVPQTALQATHWNTMTSGAGFCQQTTWASGVSMNLVNLPSPGSNCIYPTNSSIPQVFALGVVSGGNVSCGTPIGGAQFGFTSGFGIIASSGTATGGPAAIWGQVYSGP